MAAGGQVGPSISVPATPASVLTPIDETNVGARLLAKMGWSKGEGLGREKGGIAEPVRYLSLFDRRYPRPHFFAKNNAFYVILNYLVSSQLPE